MYFHMGGGKRDSWLIEASAKELFVCCGERIAHHIKRRNWWAEQQAEADQTLRAKGIELRAQPVSGGNRTDIVLDPKMAARVQECENKVREHTNHVAKFRAFQAFMGSQNENDVFKLNVDDVLYFNFNNADKNPADDSKEE